jgi:hypothetical protein
MPKLPAVMPVKALLRTVAFFCYLLVTTSILTFVLFEVFPQLLQLINPQRVRYDAVKFHYVPDKDLVLRNRIRELDIMTAGDQFGTFRSYAGDISDSPTTKKESPIATI